MAAARGHMGNLADDAQHASDAAKKSEDYWVKYLTRLFAPSKKTSGPRGGVQKILEQRRRAIRNPRARAAPNDASVPAGDNSSGPSLEDDPPEVDDLSLALETLQLRELPTSLADLRAHVRSDLGHTSDLLHLVHARAARGQRADARTPEGVLRAQQRREAPEQARSAPVYLLHAQVNKKTKRAVQKHKDDQKVPVESNERAHVLARFRQAYALVREELKRKRAEGQGEGNTQVEERRKRFQHAYAVVRKKKAVERRKRAEAQRESRERTRGESAEEQKKSDCALVMAEALARADAVLIQLLAELHVHYPSWKQTDFRGASNYRISLEEAAEEATLFGGETFRTAWARIFAMVREESCQHEHDRRGRPTAEKKLREIYAQLVDAPEEQPKVAMQVAVHMASQLAPIFVSFPQCSDQIKSLVSGATKAQPVSLFLFVHTYLESVPEIERRLALQKAGERVGESLKMAEKRQEDEKKSVEADKKP